MQLKNKVAIVTGGASGLGEATARLYAEQGAKVAIFDMNAEAGEALASTLGDNVLYRSVNVADEESASAGLADTLEAYGAIHICSNFAGIGGTPHKTVGKDFAPYPLSDWKSVIDVNLTGTFNVTRLVAAQMAQQEPVTDCGSRGVIINTASVAGYEGQVGQGAYAASKAGIIGMTICLARDLSQYGIRLNTIAPGLIHTPMFDALPDKVFDALEQSVLFPKRLGRPEEIAHLSKYIVENDYTNGETIRMDGGIRMQAR